MEMPGGKVQHGRNAGEYTRVACAAEHHDVYVGLECTPKRFEAELSDDVRRAVHVRFRQRWHGVHGAHAPGSDRLLQFGAWHIGGNHGHAEGQAVLARDFANKVERLLEMRLGAGRARRADNQWYVQPARPARDLAQVSFRTDASRRHLAAAEIGGSDVDRAHVDAGHVGRSGQARLERRRRDAIAELAGSPERTQGSATARKVFQQSRDGRHSSISRSSACCCAP